MTHHLNTFQMILYLQRIAEIDTNGNSNTVPIVFNTDNAKTKILALCKSFLFFRRTHIKVKFALSATIKSMIQ